jgi:hypothetical protein
MNKKELKEMLKPLIKECIKEVIFEDGTLSTIISEVMQGVGKPIVETKQRFPKKQQASIRNRRTSESKIGRTKK